MSNVKHVFLTGYESEDISSFLAKLNDANVTTLIDIRELPLSRKKGFSKTKLSQALGDEGIKYFHLKELGSPRDMRKKLRNDGDYLDFFKRYREHINHNDKIVDTLVNLVYDNGTTALMCFEKDCELCHRTIVASEMLKKDPTLRVTPI